MNKTNPAEDVKPYGDSTLSKKEEVAKMFDNISGRYDLLNHVLSMGIDKGWRKKAISILKHHKPVTVLDVATGTADFAIAALEAGPERVTGIDISKGMLEIGNSKIARKSLTDKIELVYGDSEALPFRDASFDAVTVAFGVRNFENLEKGLSEIHRVLKPGGMIMVLEFSKPGRFPVKQLYGTYFRYILPAIGKMISKDNAAYSYLPASVKAFPDGQDFLNILNSTGFTNNCQKPLTFGIASIYTGLKRTSAQD
jgi:demethylmenaquinone methyltransferase / 2-methoxy-6-polyprenyl-1,4-benzoquinol methylase